MGEQRSSSCSGSANPRRATLVDSRIGARVRSRRLMIDLSQEEVAERCQISPQQYYKYEAGISRISAARLVQLGEALGVPVSWFMAGIESHTELPGELAELIADTDTLELAMLFQRIDNRAFRNSVLGLVRGFLEEEGATEAATLSEQMTG